MTPELLSRYSNGGYRVEIFSDGTKIRETLDPTVAPKLPEQMDLKITDWCDAGCAWCHEGSTTRGKYGNVEKALELLSVLPAGVEIAIGGGDPLSHPEFEAFVRGLRGFGLIPNVTVNGRHFERHRKVLERLTEEGQLFGVGLSYYDRLPDWDYPHLVTHLITGVHSPAVLDAAKGSMKLLLLGYKRFGRGKKLFQIRPRAVTELIEAWQRELFWVATEHQVSFDNLAIEQLKPERLFPDKAEYAKRYMGPEGQFSMYVDAVTETFGLSSYSEDRFSWSTLKEMFARIRASQGFAAAEVFS